MPDCPRSDGDAGMSKTKSSPGDRRQLIPILDWRSAHTWRVFVGFAFLLGTAFSIVVILFGAFVDRLIGDDMPRFIVKLLIGYPILWGLGAIGAHALRRALPLKDTKGKIVAEQSIFHLGLPAFWPLPAIGWALSFLAVFAGAAMLVRDLTGDFADGFPWWEFTLTGILSIVVLDLPVRVLWRVPYKPEVSPGDE